MGPVIGDVLPFAVALTVIPIPIIAVILVLFTPRARLNAPAFVVGWMLAVFAVGAIVMTAADTGDVSTDESSSDIASAIKLLLGLALLFFAVRQWQGRPKPGEEVELPGWMSAIDAFTPAKSFGIAVLLAAANPKNLILIAGGAITIAQGGLEGAEPWIVLAVFVLLGSLSVVVPVLYYFVAGASAEKNLDVMKEWLGANNTAVMAALFLVFGVILVGQGFGGLTA